MNILIVGLGSAGQRHARVIRHLFPSADVWVYREGHFMGLISPNLETINPNLDPVDHYSMHEIYDLRNSKLEFELCVIASPINLHVEQSIPLLNLTRRLLIEKPLCITKQQLREWNRAEKESDCLVLVGYQHQFNPLLLRIRELLNKINIDMEIRTWFQEPLQSMNPFRNMKEHHLSKENGGGAFLALSHDVEFFISCFPELGSKIEGNFLSNRSVSPPLSRVSLNALFSGHSGNKIYFHSDLSFDDAATKRGGRVTFGTHEINWDLRTKTIEIFVDGKLLERNLYDYSADNLIVSQLKYLMSKEYFDDEMSTRLQRAKTIVEIAGRLSV